MTRMNKTLTLVGTWVLEIIGVRRNTVVNLIEMSKVKVRNAMSIDRFIN